MICRSKSDDVGADVIGQIGGAVLCNQYTVQGRGSYGVNGRSGIINSIAIVEISIEDCPNGMFVVEISVVAQADIIRILVVGTPGSRVELGPGLSTQQVQEVSSFPEAIAVGPVEVTFLTPGIEINAVVPPFEISDGQATGEGSIRSQTLVLEGYGAGFLTPGLHLYPRSPQRNRTTEVVIAPQQVQRLV